MPMTEKVFHVGFLHLAPLNATMVIQLSKAHSLTHPGVFDQRSFANIYTIHTKRIGIKRQGWYKLALYYYYYYYYLDSLAVPINSNYAIVQ